MSKREKLEQAVEDTRTYMWDWGLSASEYPFNFIPTGAVTFEACDSASTSGDICTVKGMYVDRAFHIQEVIYN